MTHDSVTPQHSISTCAYIQIQKMIVTAVAYVIKGTLFQEGLTFYLYKPDFALVACPNIFINFTFA
jgi:hypothetical protein